MASATVGLLFVAGKHHLMDSVAFRKHSSGSVSPDRESVGVQCHLLEFSIRSDSCEAMSSSINIKAVGDIPFPVELNAAFNSLLQNGSLEQIRHATIQHGKHPVSFDSLFCVDEISPSDMSDERPSQERTVQWVGDFSRVHGIGRTWERGRMVISGHVGDCLGERMSGGEIVVTGDAGDAVGCSMSGGRIVIEGNAGDRIGSPAPGELRGMKGGEIFVQGNAGDFPGRRMRRGTIVIQKNAGENPGLEMLAGSILLFGQYRGQPGIGMQRGSIILLQKNATDCSFGYQCEFAVRYQPLFLLALLRYLDRTGHFHIDQTCYTDCYDRYSCDMAEMERGEILVRVAN